MSNISYAAYLSELYNLRNMIKNQAYEMHQFNLRLIELEQNTPEALKPIDVWEDGEGQHLRPYSADVLFKKISELIERVEKIESEFKGFDDLITKVDTIYTLQEQQMNILNNHSKQLNELQSTVDELSGIVENSVLPSVLRIEETTEKTDSKVDAIMEKLDEILSLIKEKSD